LVTRVIAYTIGSVVAVLAVGTIFPSDMVTYADETSVMAFGVILGVLTVFVKPVLKILTLPISCLTFGLFAIVLNAALFGLAARLAPDVEVTVWGAVIGGVFAAVINGVVFSIVEDS
jgi:putative membrane protein